MTSDCTNALRANVKEALEATIEEWAFEFVDSLKDSFTLEYLICGQVAVLDIGECSSEILSTAPISQMVDEFISKYKDEDDNTKLFMNLAACFEAEYNKLRRAANAIKKKADAPRAGQQ